MKCLKSKVGSTDRRSLLWLSGAICLLVLLSGVATASDRGPGQGVTESTGKKDDQMKNRVLIVYASRSGSTAGVAEAIGKRLCEMGAAVDVRSVENVNDLSHYKGVIAGSAIRKGRWLPEATAFVKTHHETLNRVPTAYFVVCNTMKDDTPENRTKVMAYLDPVYKAAPDVKPVNVGLFAGAVDFDKLSFVNKSMLRVLGVSEGDFRNWDAIRTWTSDVAPTLLGK
jgi:menaquinone-dependent protoporphyrinogen oxidase